MKNLLTVIRFLFIAIMLSVGTFASGISHSAQAAPLKGYLWTLSFDFESDFNGELTLMVGPWQNGSLSEVEEKSATVVECKPVGDVVLQKGYAGFINGGYLQCNLDIATALLKNHGMVANAVDSYGSFSMHTVAQVSNGTVAPIFEHSDAKFWLTTPSPAVVTVNSDLSNGGGIMTSWFSSVLWNGWQSYSSHYECVSIGGSCDMTQGAAGMTQILTNQGAPQQFVTGESIITIGRVGADTLNGRIDSLIVDPGDYGHH